MQAPRELDVVEVVADGAGVPRGTQATVVHDYANGDLLLEVVGPDGQATAMPVVSRRAVRVIWRPPAAHAVATSARPHAG
jgi:hypothetical protein